jgi:hypothetical protein
MKAIPVVTAFLSSLASAQVLSLMHPAEPMPEKRTVIWTPTFQVAWDALNKDLGGKPTKVEPPSPVMKLLDDFAWDPATTMPEGAWKAWAGPASYAFVDQVNKEVAEIAINDEKPFSIEEEKPDRRVVFAMLSRRVSFTKAFLRAKHDNMDFQSDGKSQAVKYFGIPRERADAYSGSVKVLAYRPAENSCAIEIECREKDDRVVLFLPSKPLDFLTACSWVRTWRKAEADAEDLAGKWNDPHLHLKDEVRIPYVQIDVETDFTHKLQSSRYYNGTTWRIAGASQLSRFRLHERGAEVEVRAKNYADPFGGVETPIYVPRRFYFDRPFFVFLWRAKAEWPYFGAWIGDSSTLTAVPES